MSKDFVEYPNSTFGKTKIHVWTNKGGITIVQEQDSIEGVAEIDINDINKFIQFLQSKISYRL